jgi:hypothetical protein
MSKVMLIFTGVVLFLGWSLSSTVNGAVVVSNSSELVAAINNANSGGDKTILLRDGRYTLNDMLGIYATGMTVAGLSGNRDSVIVEGAGMSGGVTHIFNVAGSNFTAQDMTLQKVSNHAIQLQVDVDSVSIRNLHILDTYEQMVKIAYDPGNLSARSDDGLMENCLLEYSAGIGPQYYIGGIDGHNARNWIVRNNTFRGFRSPSGDTAEHAIHFWSDSANTLVEGNLIINCDRGIGFGLGDRGHSGGIIRNNMIYHDSSQGFADIAIGLESSPGTQVYNNTVYCENSYPNAIEYRFGSTTGVLIANNLTNRAIAQRDGASGTVSHNLTNSQASWFINPSIGDLHLSYAVPAVVDQGESIPGLTVDFDGGSRPQGAGIDIGADEYGAGAVTPTPAMVNSAIQSGDYNGDGTSDIAVFRGSSGLWAVRGVTRDYFGESDDIPVSGDYNGDGVDEIGIFRTGTGLWAIRGITREYFGSSSDQPVPGDYDGDNICDIGIFRPGAGLWAVRGVTRDYFGSSGDKPVPGDYNGDHMVEIGIFRDSSGLWALRFGSRFYFGSTGDETVPGDYNGDGTWEAGIFHRSYGLWAIRGITRSYFGSPSDQPVPADYMGTGSDSIGIFRPSSGLWAINGATRAYFGRSNDLPVTR